MSYDLGIDISEWSADIKFKLGTVISADNIYGSARYRYVKLRNEATTVAAVVGDMAAYLSAPNLASNVDEANTVVTDNTNAASNPIGAGMIQSAVAGVSLTAYYGWVQIDGFAIANATISGSPADGDTLAVLADKTLGLAIAADTPICAYGVDVSVKMVRLQCP